MAPFHHWQIWPPLVCHYAADSPQFASPCRRVQGKRDLRSELEVSSDLDPKSLRTEQELKARRAGVGLFATRISVCSELPPLHQPAGTDLSAALRLGCAKQENG